MAGGSAVWAGGTAVWAGWHSRVGRVAQPCGPGGTAFDGALHNRIESSKQNIIHSMVKKRS